MKQVARALLIVVGIQGCSHTSSCGEFDADVYSSLENERIAFSLEERVRARPDDIDASYSLAGIYLEEFFYQKAARRFESIYLSHPGEVDAYVWHAQVLREGTPTDLARAVRVLERGVRNIPENGVLKAFLADVYLESSRLADAVATARIAEQQTDATGYAHLLSLEVMRSAYSRLDQSTLAEQYARKLHEARVATGINVPSRGVEQKSSRNGSPVEYFVPSSHPTYQDRIHCLDAYLRKK